MATIHSMTGFETGNSAEVYSTSGTFSVQATTVKTGGYALQVDTTAGAGTDTGFAVIGKFSTTNNTIINNGGNTSPQVCGFWFRAGTLPASGSEPICSFHTGAGVLQAQMRVTSTGKLQLYNSDGTTQVGSDSTATISTGTWYHIEMYCNAGAAGSRTGRIYVDGSLDATAQTTAGTFATAASDYDIVRVGKTANVSSQTVNFYFDDIYRADDTLAANKPVIERMQPDTPDGTYTGFSGGTGSSNYLEVDEVTPDNGTTYVQSIAANTASTFNFESTATAGISGTIHAAQFCTWGIRVGAGLAHDLRIRSGGSDFDYADTALAGSYDIRGQALSLDPATTAAWTTGGLDAVEVGMEETASSTNRVRLSTVWITVLFTPAAGGTAIKTKNDLAKASVKTINDLAIASVKTVNGL